MVLTRRLTQVRPLEEALEAEGLRFTTEGGKSFFNRQEVHETLAVLRAIAANPERRAADLAAEFGRPRLPFKVDVRKLKELGLTESLPIG